MLKLYRIILLFTLFAFTLDGISQTTIPTTGFVNNNGNSTTTFNFQNTNGFDVIITGIDGITSLNGANTAQLWFKPTPISGPIGGVNVGNGWTQVLGGTQTFTGVANTTTAVTQPFITGVSLTIPAGATYGLAVSCTSLRYSTVAAGTYTFPGGGCNLICGSLVSYGGALLNPAFTPRAFMGSVTFIPAVPCTSPPTAGTVTASSNPVCPASSTSLSISGGTSGTGQTFQWLSSTDNITFNPILGATNSSYSATQSVDTYYQAIITCTGLSDTTTSLLVTTNPFFNCYPVTTGAAFTADDEIYNVKFNSDSTNALYSYGNTCTTVAPGPGSLLNRYSNFRTLAPITSVAPGSTVSFQVRQNECDGPTLFSNGIAIWIDYNHNGSWSDPGEQVYVEATTSPATGPSPAGDKVINGTFTIPITALTGNTGLRVICVENSAGAALLPNMTYNWGETEDYLFNIQCPVLASTGTVDQGICSGATAVFTATPSIGGATISWWDASTGGTQLGTGTTFTTPALVATTQYYVQEDFPSCPSSSTRDTVEAIVSPVDVVLTPVNVTCNGGNNGSFTLGTVSCGVAPFTYSIDGGVTYTAIPTNLTVGTYFVIVQDATTLLSAPIQVIITQPTAPTTLTATGITFFNATLGWTATGDETSYNVEYGPAGFVQGTGTTVTSSTTSTQLTTLTEDTDYEFYVQTGCGAGAEWAGPFAFSTDVPFFANDNQCGPGFIDISTTGAPAGFFSLDDDVADVLLPWPWNINGQTVTTIGIGTNGHVAFAAGSFVTYNPAGPGLYICNADLQSIDANGAYYESIGTAPNRQFIIQWVGMQDYPAAGAGSPSVTFEIIVDEATSEVYYIYDNSPSVMPAYAAMVGIDIAAISTNGSSIVQTTGTLNIQNNSCYHFYNALCPNVQNLTGIIFSDDALIDWNAGQYGETEWTVIYGLEGFDPAIPAEQLGNFTLPTSDVNFGGSLTQLTSYDVYIYSECTTDNLTSNGTLYQFTTKPYCADVTALAGTTDPDTMNLTWNFIPNPGYALQQFNLQYAMEGTTLADFTEIIAGGLNNADSIVDPSLLGSGVYEVYVQAVCLTGDTSNWVGPISLIMPLTNDTVCGAETLIVDETEYIFNNSGATVSLNESTIAPPATGAQTTDGWINSTVNNSVWYKFIAPATGNMRIKSTGRAYNGQIGVYELTNCDDFNTFSLLAANDNEIGGASLAPNFTVCGLTPGNEYYIMFDGFNGTQGEFAISLKEIVLQAGTANPTSEICSEDEIVLFNTISGFSAGGTWTAPIAAVNASITDSLFTSTGLAYQTFSFEYRVVDGCAYDSIVSTVQVFAPSSAGTDGTINACRNEPINLLAGLNGTADLGGQWFDPSNAATTNDITTLNFAGSYNYDYIVGNGVCPDDTANVVVIVSGCNYLSIEDLIFEGVSIHPNPTSGILFIESGLAFTMTITDANGRFISTNTTSVSIGTTTVDLSKVERGVYFVNLSDGTSEKMYRVIVQ